MQRNREFLRIGTDDNIRNGVSVYGYGILARINFTVVKHQFTVFDTKICINVIIVAVFARKGYLNSAQIFIFNSFSVRSVNNNHYFNGLLNYLRNNYLFRVG